MPLERLNAVLLALLLAGCQGAEDASPPAEPGPRDATPASADPDAHVPPGRITVASTKSSACISSFVLAGSNLYWTTPTNLMSAPKAGGPSTTLAALGLSVTTFSGLAVSGTTAYWFDPAVVQVWRSPLAWHVDAPASVHQKRPYVDEFRIALAAVAEAAELRRLE